MIDKQSKLHLDANSVIDRDMLLFGPRKASFVKHDISENLVTAKNPIDVIAEIGESDPDNWVVFRTRAIDAGGSDKTGEEYHGPNDNGDWFSEEELLAEDEDGIKSFETFIGCPVFTNHKNDDVEQARGRIVNAFYDLTQHCVYVDGLIDAKAYPQLARGVKMGYISDTSMGALYESSRILMSNGIWKRHDEIIPGDNVVTHTGQIQPVTMIMRTNEKIEGFEISFVGQDQPIKATYDHPIFAIKKETVDESVDYSPSFIESKDLEIGDYLLTPKGLVDNDYNDDENDKRFIWNEYLCTPITDIKEFKNSGVYCHLEVGGNENEEINSKSDHSYIADGVSVHNCSVKSSECSICKNIAETEDQYCLVPGTKITLGNKELCDIDEIEVGQEVLTHDGTSKKIKEVMVRDIDEDIFEIYVSGSNIPLEITGNHPIYRLPKMEYRETFEKYYKDKKFNPEFVDAENIQIGDYLLSPTYPHDTTTPKDIDKMFARLCGIYLAEGNIFRQNNKIQGIEFSISSEETDLRDDILSLCKEITKKEAKFYNKQGNSCHIRICDKKLGEDFLRIVGEYSRKKYIGSDIFKWSDCEKKEFLGGYIDGDGNNFQNKNIQIRTSSRNITLQIQKLLSSINSWATIHNHDQIDNDLVQYREGQERDTNLIQISNISAQSILTKNCIKLDGFLENLEKDTTSHWLKNGYDIVKVRKISKKQYKGKVFNISVEENENYIANNVIVHNCSHIKSHKGKKINGSRVYEKNHKIKFIENSFVTDGACLNCTVQNAYTGAELLDEISRVMKTSNEGLVSLRKVASLDKSARGEDIDKLNKSLDLLKEVADQILNSKDVDYEFLEDIGGLLAQLQNLVVDLVEAGFANQVGDMSPGVQDGGGEQEPEINQTPSGGQSNQELTAPPEPAQAMGGAPAGAPAGLQQSPLISTTSVKKYNEKYANKLKDLEGIGTELKVLVSNINNLIEEIGDENMLTKRQKARKTASNAIAGRFSQILDEQMADDEPVVVTDGEYSVSFLPSKGIEGYAGGKKVATMSVEDLGDELTEVAKINPQLVAGRIIQALSEKYYENGERKMAQKDISKEALLTQTPPVDQIQEGQLDDMQGNFDRKNDETLAVGQVGVTTEGQLENVPKTPETGKGDFKRVRPDGIAENLEITEGQLSDSSPTNFGAERVEDDTAAAEGQLGQIMEGQMEDEVYGTERWEDNVADGDMPITEGQFDGKDRLGTAVDEVQEGQVEGHRLGTDSTVASDASPHGRKASVQDRVITAFVNGLANASVANRIKPETLIANASITSDGIKTHKAVSIKKASKISSANITKLAEYEIGEEIGSANMDSADEFLQDTIETLFEDKEVLTEAVNDAVEAMSGDIEIVNEEEQRKSSVASAWKTRTAGKPVVIDAAQLTALFPGVGDLSKLDPDVVAAKVLEQHPGATIMKSKRDQNGAFIFFMDGIKESPIEESIGSQEPQMDVPIGSENIVEEGLISASVVDKLQRLAQSPAGTTMPPPGGMPAPGGAGPAGPGLEDLGGSPGVDDIVGDTLEEEEEDFGSDGEAKPFGTICPVCGSDDVAALDGKFNCNACGAKYELSVNMNVLNPEKFSDVGIGAESEDEDLSEGEDINDELGAEPAAAPMGMEAPPVPAPAMQPGMAHSDGWIREAALKFSMKIDPKVFVNKGRKLTSGVASPVGTICPQCASRKVAFSDSTGTCVDCGCKTHITASKGKGTVNVEMLWQPNIRISETENKFEDGTSAGFAVTADCEDCEEISKALHEILSDRSSLVKIASFTEEKFPMLACMSDQIANGYTDEDSANICASLKDVMTKTALINEDEDDEEMEEETGFDFDNDDESAEGEEHEEEIEEVDGDDIEDEDFVEFEDDDDNVELEDDEGSKDITDAIGDVQEVTGITVDFVDSEGNEGEFSLSTGDEAEEDIMGDEGDIIEIEEEIDLDPEELGEVDEEFGEEAEEVDDEEILSDFFTDGTEMIEEENSEMMAEETQLTPEESKAKSEETSEYLRAGRVRSSEAGGGKSMDLSAVAQALGISMPLDTEADVPRDEDQGIAEDGTEEVHSTDHDNDAKDMTGTAAGSSLADDDAVQGAERGVEVIEPSAQAASSKKIKEAQATLRTSPADDLDVRNVFDNDFEEEVVPDNDNGIVGVMRFLDDHPEIDADAILAELEEKARNNFGTDETMFAKNKEIVKTAEEQLEPVDSLQEDKTESNSDESSLDVPRDESKAKPEIDPGDPSVNNPTEIREKNYELGPGATDLHTEVVPRDGGGDGIGGKKPKFDQESGDKQTSGNPDSYVQDYQGTLVEPTSADDVENHATTGPNTASTKDLIKKIAKAQGIKKANIRVYEKEGTLMVKDSSTDKVYKIVAKKECCKKCKCNPCECKKDEEKEASTDAITKVAESKKLDPANLQAIEEGGHTYVLDIETQKIYRV